MTWQKIRALVRCKFFQCSFHRCRIHCISHMYIYASRPSQSTLFFARYLHVITTNTPALKFYDAIGFMQVKLCEDFYTIDNEDYDALVCAYYVNGWGPPPTLRLQYALTSLSTRLSGWFEAATCGVLRTHSGRDPTTMDAAFAEKTHSVSPMVADDEAKSGFVNKCGVLRPSRQ